MTVAHEKSKNYLKGNVKMKPKNELNIIKPQKRQLWMEDSSHHIRSQKENLALEVTGKNLSLQENTCMTFFRLRTKIEDFYNQFSNLGHYTTFHNLLRTLVFECFCPFSL